MNNYSDWFRRSRAYHKFSFGFPKTYSVVNGKRQYNFTPAQKSAISRIWLGTKQSSGLDDFVRQAEKGQRAFIKAKPSQKRSLVGNHKKTNKGYFVAAMSEGKVIKIGGRNAQLTEVKNKSGKVVRRHVRIPYRGKHENFEKWYKKKYETIKYRGRVADRFRFTINGSGRLGGYGGLSVSFVDSDENILEAMERGGDIQSGEDAIFFDGVELIWTMNKKTKKKKK